MDPRVMRMGSDGRTGPLGHSRDPKRLLLLGALSISLVVAFSGVARPAHAFTVYSVGGTVDSTLCTGNGGTFSSSTCTLSGTVEWLVTGAGNSLTVPFGLELDLNGAALVVDGSTTLTNDGLILMDFASQIQDYGTVWNNGHLDDSATGRLQVNPGATLNNVGDLNCGLCNNNNILNNYGTMTNVFEINGNPGSALNNFGTLTNAFLIDTVGAINNHGTIVNNKDIDIAPGGTMTNDGTIDNSGTLLNQGVVTNAPSGNIINSGTIDNQGQFVNLGTITNLCGGVVKGNPIEGNPVVNVACSSVPEFPLGFPALLLAAIPLLLLLRRKVAAYGRT